MSDYIIYHQVDPIVYQDPQQIEIEGGQREDDVEQEISTEPLVTGTDNVMSTGVTGGEIVNRTLPQSHSQDIYYDQKTSHWHLQTRHQQVADVPSHEMQHFQDQLSQQTQLAQPPEQHFTTQINSHAYSKNTVSSTTSSYTSSIDYGLNEQPLEYYHFPGYLMGENSCTSATASLQLSLEFQPANICETSSIIASPSSSKGDPQNNSSGKRKFGSSTNIPYDEVTRQKPQPWSEKEELKLLKLIQSGIAWSNISKEFPHRSPGAIKKHFYAHMKNESWTKVEDEYLLQISKEFEDKKWKTIVETLGRSIRSCKRRVRELELGLDGSTEELE
jgi:hypothetical protein